MTREEAKFLAKCIAKEMKHIADEQAQLNEEFLTTKECAALLKVSQAWVYSHDELPSVKVGGSIRYPKSQIIKHILLQ